MMPEIDENQKIKMITEFLEKGGTMLSNHHECGAPMFRYQGKVLCPVCDYQKKQEKIQEITITKTKEPEATKKPQAEYYQIAALTKNKIQGIAASLEGETDLQRVKEKMECIELGIKILKLLEG